MLTKKNKIKLFVKGTPPTAIVSAIMGIISILVLILSFILSIVYAGEAGMYLGIMGVLAMIVNAIGFALGTKSFNKSDSINYAINAFAIGTNGVMFIIYMIFYISGFLMSIA